ncbi:MAG TPA: hypothetical protein VGP44_05215 [Gemmatimonadales bacterium]|nr:hypothetical protein [Gemmatimonadales bacterium]
MTFSPIGIAGPLSYPECTRADLATLDYSNLDLLAWEHSQPPSSFDLTF